jgi:outer membrane receptor protein involved in Fe transport
MLRLCISWLLSPALLLAQGNLVRGHVQDTSGAAIANAVVIASDGNETRSDAQGDFVIPEHVDRLTVRASGFAEVTLEASDLREPIVLRAAAREQVVVTPTRGPASVLQSAASVSIVSAEELDRSGAVTLDQALRAVPGFTLFRRSSSLTANPTAQGVSLRGVGASGASRALVLEDGVPLNDPFGGWVQWTRVPALALDGTEVVRGGSSYLYGSDALSGVVNLLPLRPATDMLIIDGSYGGYHTPDLSVLASGIAKGWRAAAAGQVFDTDGYIQVRAHDKGAVDTPADVRFGTARLNIGRDFGAAQLNFGGAFFNEARANGTPLQTNDTRLGSGAASISTVADGNALRFQIYGGAQHYDQSFSAIASNRNSETLSRLQHVPAQQIGGSAQWSRIIGRNSLTAGFDLRNVRGKSNETIFAGGSPATLVSSGGKQLSTGVYGQDTIRLAPRWWLTLGGRVDVWKNYQASSQSAPVANPSTVTLTSFPSRTDSAFSPHAAVVFQPAQRFALHTSYYGSFRAPTLNELYRAFRVGNVLTLGNSELKPERLYGGEFGAQYVVDRTRVSAAFFWSEVKDPVVNRTLTITPALITRRRENLGQTRARGVELELRHNITANFSVSGGYQFVDSTIVSFPSDRSLEGLLLPQIPQNQFSFGATYSPRNWTFSYQGRFVGQQFDDDQNVLPLDRFFTADAYISRQLGPSLQVYVAAENVFDQRYEVGRTPVVSIGPPILARAGLRITVGRR